MVVLMGIGMGRTNDRVARLQETYVANATSGWLESLERSLVMMKEYQVCHIPPFLRPPDD